MCKDGSTVRYSGCGIPDQAIKGGHYVCRICGKEALVILGLPFTFTKYVIKEDMITVDTGVFTKVENDCYMYKVQDVEHTASIWERMAGLGTIVCYTGDTTHPKLLIEHIRNSKQIKEFILKESEEARLKRRTVNMLDIGSGEIGDIDDLQ